MSVYTEAFLCYGIPITKGMLSPEDIDDLQDGDYKGLTAVSWGSAFTGEGGYVLAISESQLQLDNDWYVAVPPPRMVVKPEWRERLVKFLTEDGRNCSEHAEPAWIMGTHVY
jgi:hypothetical protein